MTVKVGDQVKWGQETGRVKCTSGFDNKCLIRIDSELIQPLYSGWANVDDVEVIIKPETK